jgi:dihydroorotase
MQMLLKGGRLLDPLAGRDEECDILLVDGRIEKIGTSIAAPAAQVIDMRGKIIAPGFMDMHVHLREPGFEHKETILTGVSAAAAGGFTAVCCMPNTRPAIDEESVIRYIQGKAAAALDGLVDVYPVAAVTLERKGERLAPLAELAQAGAVGFSDDGDPVQDAELMRRALEYAAMFKKPVIQHAQDVPLTRGSVMNEGFNATALGLAGWPGVAEEIMVARDLRLTEYTGGRYHVAHISTAGTVQIVREGKARGIAVTCEVAPHHFTLTDDAVLTYDTNTKMNPPLRTAKDIDAILQGLRDGTVDVIATDHAPHSFDEKEVEFQQAPFGIVGLETAIGLAITELVLKNVISLSQMVEKFSVNPRRILNLPPVTVAEGSVANLTLIDPALPWVVDPRTFKSKSKNSPFGGRRLTGKPMGVMNHGRVYWAQ